MDTSTFSTMVTGLVGLMSAYMTYRVGLKQAEDKKEPKQVVNTNMDKRIINQGEKALITIKEAVETYGDTDERQDFTSFERNPTRYKEALIRVLTDIAQREPEFGSQIERMATDSRIQIADVRGEVKVTGHGKIYGQAVGTNTGTMTGTYNIDIEEDKKTEEDTQ